MKFSLSLAILVMALGCTSAQDKAVQSGPWHLDIKGNSGKIAYFNQDDAGNKVNKTMIEMKKIVEVDAKGDALKGGKTKHSFMNFASQKFTFSNIETVMYKGAECTNTNFTGTLADVGAELSVELYLVHNESEFVSGNESFTAIKGALKFNIVLKNWKFCGVGDVCKKGQTVLEGHSVCLYIIIKEENAKGEAKKKGESKGKKKGKKRAKRFSLGGFNSVILPEEVEIDGEMKKLDPAPNITTDGGTKSQFKLCFPRFNDTAIYDPVTQQDDDGTGDGDGGDGDKPSAAATVLFSFFLLIFSLFVAVDNLRL